MAKILVIASSLEKRSILALVLELGGYGCEPTGSLWKATALLQKKPFDIIVADCCQDNSISALARRLKVFSPMTTVIFLHKTAEPREQEADGIILTLRSPQDLFDSIQGILKRKPPIAEKDTTMVPRQMPA